MREVLQLLIDRIDTPIGEMFIVADHEGNLRAVDWTEYEARMLRLLRLHYGEHGFRLQPARNPYDLAKTMARYFGGDLQAVETLPVRTGGTPFQRQVWRALREIICGTTVSYAKLAERIGQPTAVRAVGLANGSNPVGIVVPCHRVIGSNGSLTGYGGGIERKRWLLAHEGASAAAGKPHQMAFDSMTFDIQMPTGA
jgi:methylated-DNA-[protein]-cysteine S-methyltransferase